MSKMTDALSYSPNSHLHICGYLSNRLEVKAQIRSDIVALGEADPTALDRPFEDICPSKDFIIAFGNWHNDSKSFQHSGVSSLNRPSSFGKVCFSSI